MNRLVLIGNGIDLAHDLKTSYGEFIDWLWEEYILSSTKKLNENITLNLSEAQFEIRSLGTELKQCKTFKALKKIIARYPNRVIINNNFLRIISYAQIESWVDIEATYYDLLIEIITTEKDEGNQMNRISKYQLDNYSIENLNEDFDQIKAKLIEYLDDKISKTPLLHSEIKEHLLSEFLFNDFSRKTQRDKINLELTRIQPFLSEIKETSQIDDWNIKSILEETGPKPTKKLIQELLEDPEKGLLEYFGLLPKNIYLLDFNYTRTSSLYEKEITGKKGNLVTDLNHIHGSLSNQEENPIIFGFGDELDEQYKKIENINDNRYLENIKSIEYLQAPNYKNLLNFIESDMYQVFIMGHSCGLSDRTLLNTIFEHENCVSIKPFYREKEDGSNNYKKIVQNISRHFNDKARMRDVVVDKSRCEQLVKFKQEK